MSDFWDRLERDHPGLLRLYVGFWYAVFGIFALFLLAGIALWAAGWESRGSATSQFPSPLSTPTTQIPPPDEASTPQTTRRTTTTTDPSIGRPVYKSFVLLAFLDAETMSTCNEKYGGDLAACYDGFERGTPGFEDVIRNNVAVLAARGSGYSSGQYGCHADGRCLDDFDTWCDEGDVSYFEEVGLVCYAEDLDWDRDYFEDRYP